MSRVLMEYLLNCYQGADIFKLNNVYVTMGLKDVVLIPRLKFINPPFRTRESDEVLYDFRNRTFPSVRQLSYQDINQVF